MDYDNIELSLEMAVITSAMILYFPYLFIQIFQLMTLTEQKTKVSIQVCMNVESPRTVRVSTQAMLTVACPYMSTC